MELVHYLRIVRRRWRLVLVFVILGVLAGTGTGFFRTSRNPSATFYLAKHTLSSTDSATNLARDAQLCTDGEIVAKRVAPKIGFGDPTSLNAQVVCEPHSDTGLLYVAAVDDNPREAIAIADAWSEELVAYLRETAQAQTQDKLQRLRTQQQDKTQQLQDKSNQLNAEKDPTQRDILTQQRNDLQTQISQLNGQISQAESTQAPAESLTTLSTANSADAFPISASAFETLMSSAGSAKGQAAGNSPTQNAARQSQIDLAVKTDNSIPGPTRAAFGGLLGLLLGATVVIVLDRVDPRIRTKFEAEEAFGWPVVGEIPPLSRHERSGKTVFAVDEPRSRTAEAYRVLRSALLFVQTGGSGDPDEHPIFSGEVPNDDAEAPKRGQVIMVTSPGPSEGKTTTAANMAAILGETGRSVLVVNCDFRRPRIHEHLGAENVPRQVVDTRVPNVKLVTQVLENADDANPALVVQTQRQVIRNAREMFDIILLDTAPLLTTNDATEVLSVADQVAIIAKTGKTHKEAADRAAELLERRGAPVIGIVLVGATDVPTSRYYYYGAADHGTGKGAQIPRTHAPEDAPAPASAPSTTRGSEATSGSDADPGVSPDAVRDTSPTTTDQAFATTTGLGTDADRTGPTAGTRRRSAKAGAGSTGTSDTRR